MVKSLISFLDKKFVIEVGGVKVSYFAFVLAFFVLHLIISAFIKAGGVKDD